MKHVPFGVRVGAVLVLGLLVPACQDYNHHNQFNGSFDWFVDPLNGSDATGNGSPSLPFQSIRVALLNAVSGDFIFLTNGTYSSAHEVFPIVVKSGVTIVGDASSNGTGILISGSGSYSVTGGSQAGGPPLAVTILMAAGSQLTGVTITNSAAGGIGVVFDGTAAQLLSCTVTGCTVSAVQTFQAATPTISSCTLTQSGGSGVVVWDSSAPLLRGNAITHNTVDGVLANDTSVPDLGDVSSAGGNTIQNNATGLANATTASTIPAAGNLWTPSTQGADASGHYATGPAAPGSGTNYSITNSPAASIEF